MFKCSPDTPFSFDVTSSWPAPALRHKIHIKRPIKYLVQPASLLPSPLRGAVKMVYVDLTSISVVISQSCDRLYDLYPRLWRRHCSKHLFLSVSECFRNKSWPGPVWKKCMPESLCFHQTNAVIPGSIRIGMAASRCAMICLTVLKQFPERWPLLFVCGFLLFYFPGFEATGPL